MTTAARRVGATAAALGALAALPLALAGAAHADTGAPTPDPSASASASGSAAPAPAGGSFLSAPSLSPGQNGQATGSVGDYFYWSFQAQAGQAPTVTATVQLPPGAQRHGAETWRVDLYDGLQRHQPCVTGTAQSAADTGADSVQLTCTLPGIRSWAPTWSDDPLPGTYYARLTVGDLPEQDLGLPVTAQLSLATPAADTPSSDGSLSTPLSLSSAGPTPTTDPAASAAPAAASAKGGFLPDINPRWWWTAGAAIAGSLAAVLGFSLTRHPRRRLP